MDGCGEGKEPNLHECFGIIPGPLLEVATLLKTTEPREWRCQRDAVVKRNEKTSPEALALTYRRSISSKIELAFAFPC